MESLKLGILIFSLPLDFSFSESIPARLVLPKPNSNRAKAVWSFDGDHIRASFWENAAASTGSTEMFVEVYETGAYWPVRNLRTAPPEQSAIEKLECITPENSLYDQIERPQREGECVIDSECEISGCQNEICAAKSVVTECQERPILCSACRCLGSVCRWTK
mgnify:CR=1 FL=1